MGTGGMRYNAGRPAYYGKAEHCLRLDIRRWGRESGFRDGTYGTWQWTHDDEHRSTVGYRIEHNAIKLSYSVDGVPSPQSISLTQTRCNYGGTRRWFICPIRGERVAVLYLRAGRFACRHCQRLAYASQSDDAIDRSWRRQRKAEARLDKGWRKPKGMHWATRERLLSIIWDCEDRRDEAIMGYLVALARRHPSLAGELLT